MKKIVLLLLGSVLLSACAEKVQADLLITNANIYTVDDANSVAKAMAIKDGMIISIGTDVTILDLYEAPEILDMEGKFIYPGFNDAHAHFVGYATGLRKVNLVGTKSFDEVLNRVQEFAQNNPLPFIEGRGWDQNDWPTKAFPNKEKLDELFPETPVLLKRIDGHAALANSAALKYAGIDANTSVEGGLVELANGAPSGILIDKAVGLVVFPELPRDQKIEALRDAENNLLEVGVTSLTDAGLLKKDILLLDSLQEAGDLKIRINAMVADDSASLNYFLEEGAIEKPRLRVKSGKFYLDGALGSRGALLLEPYSDDTSNYGLQLMRKSYFEKWAKRLADEDWQMCVHAIGDSANRLAIDVMLAAVDSGLSHRWRIEHAQIVHPEDVPQMALANILPSVQPTHATSDMYWAANRLGDRISYAYPYKDLLEACGVLPLGTDFPVEDIDPLKTFRAVVFRQDAQAFPDSSFLPSQKLTPDEALRGMTFFGAFASFEEDFKGQLIPNRVADFVVFEKDIMHASVEDLSEMQALQTWLDGEVVFEKD